MTESILFTGISGALGQLITHKLHNKVHIIGIDKRPFSAKPANVELHDLDLRRKSAIQLLSKKKIDCIIHIGVIRGDRPRRENSAASYFNLETTTQVLRLAEQLGVRKFIFLSSSYLYGPSGHTAGFLSEDSPLHGAASIPDQGDLVALDIMVQSFFLEATKYRDCHFASRPHCGAAPQ